MFARHFSLCRYLCTWLLPEARVLQSCRRGVLEAFLGCPEAAGAGSLVRAVLAHRGGSEGSDELQTASQTSLGAHPN